MKGFAGMIGRFGFMIFLFCTLYLMSRDIMGVMLSIAESEGFIKLLLIGALVFAVSALFEKE